MARIWIDLDNSPHVPLFAPIAAELTERGHEVTITARDAFQVRELADLHKLRYQLIGRHYGKHTALKLLGLGGRAAQLLPTALRRRFQLAVSHGSRSQLVVASALGIPSLLIADYEFARTHAFIRPTWLMLPELIPATSVKSEPHRILRYPGIKEDVYVPRFVPDRSLRHRLGASPSDILVTIRPPATEAHYHNPESELLFNRVMDALGSDQRVRMIVLPRTERQGRSIRQGWSQLVESGRVLIPPHAEDGLNLIWNSDLVISGGGTMNREAAALGVPVYTIFRGPLGAVDKFLSNDGRLVVLATLDDIATKLRLQPRDIGGGGPPQTTRALSVIVRHINALSGAAASSASYSPEGA